MEDSGTSLPPVAATVQPRRQRRWPLLGALVLLLGGIGAGGWGMHVWLTDYAGGKPAAALATSRNVGGDRVVDMAAALPAPSAAPASVDDSLAAAAPVDLSGRIAALEARLAAISVDTSSLNGNAARAEALLIAFAARRALDRGLALGTLESQLRLRFGDAQPNAVKTVIAAAAAPVTLERLQSGLDELAPALSGGVAANAGFWARTRRELGSLFVLRSADAPSTRLEVRVERARRWLDAGLVDRAADEVAALPDAAIAAGWLADARRYHDARRALDLIETAAILAPRETGQTAAPAASLPRP